VIESRTSGSKPSSSHDRTGCSDDTGSRASSGTTGEPLRDIRCSVCDRLGPGHP
jgi:hypothetical protein